jgi:Spherulation-specific family 4
MTLAGNEIIECVLPAGQITTGQIAALNSAPLSPGGKRPGILIPFYFYPNNPYTDAQCERLFNLLRTYHDVSVIIVVNAGNPGGPGTVNDGNWAAFIQLAQAAGATVLGYVDSAYGLAADRTGGIAAVFADIANWNILYASTPVNGIFFDRQSFDTTTQPLYQQFYAAAHNAGYTFVMSNPGVNQGGTWYTTNPPTSDAIIINEASSYISVANAWGNFSGGHVGIPWYKNAIIAYDQTVFDTPTFNSLRRFARWLYITDQNLPTPYGALSAYLEQLFAACAYCGTNPNYVYNQPVTTFNLTLTAPVTTLDPSGTLASGTLTFPATPLDGDQIIVSTTHTITSLTCAGNGNTIANAPTTLTAGNVIRMMYNVTNTTWYNI